MKMVEVITDAGSADTISAIAETYNARDFRKGVTDEEGMQSMRLLVADDKIQPVLDSLQNAVGSQPATRIFVIPVGRPGLHHM